MKLLKAEYVVKEGEVENVLDAVQKFVTEIRANEPGVLRYDAYQVSETEFLHIMAFFDEEAEEEHKQAEHTRRFVNAVYPRCEQEPVFSKIKHVMSAQK